MTELLGRRRFRRSARWAACIPAAVLLCVVPFAGSALADDESSDSPPSADSSSSSSSSSEVSPPNTSEDDLAGLPEVSFVEGTPCTPDTVACVSISDHKAWLFDNGAISHGPVDVATGGPGQETPLGDHHVQWKNKNHKSQEFKLPDGQPSPMPFAVFFADGGVAFHEGTLERRSAGCVRLNIQDAQRFYTYLQLGDKVQIAA
jgi:hypothetical protein